MLIFTLDEVIAIYGIDPPIGEESIGSLISDFKQLTYALLGAPCEVVTYD